MTAANIEQGNKILRVLVFALIFSVMNGTMFNVALPMIGNEFNLKPSELSWIMTSYMVLYAIGSVVYGKLADRFQLKTLLTFGLIIFAVGSVIGMSASHYWMIVLGRIVQAAGAAVMPATSMIIPIRYFPAEQRGRALGTSAIGLALGSALGPVVAGAISGLGSWRLLFVFSLLSLVTLPFFCKYLGSDQVKSIKIDYIGGGLLGGSIALLLLAITQTNIVLALLFVVVTILFITRIKLAKEPFIQPILFTNRYFVMALCIAFITTAMNFALTFISPQFLAKLNDLSASSIGFVLFPAAIASALLGRVGGKLADARGNRYLMLLASSLMLICYVLLSSFVGAVPYLIAGILIFGNIGQTFMQITMSNTISRTLKQEQVGVGMGLFSMMNFISGAISMSVIGKLLDQQQISVAVNPFVKEAAAYMYSNIFAMMGLLVIVSLILYWIQFRDSGALALVRKKAG